MNRTVLQEIVDQDVIFLLFFELMMPHVLSVETFFDGNATKTYGA